MKKVIHLVIALTTIILFQHCRDESENILPEIILVKDSTAAVSTSLIGDSTLISDTSKVNDSIIPSDTLSTDSAEIVTTTKPKSELDFSGTNIYQKALFQNMPYRVMTPAHYTSEKQYPLVIFLHGIDERGTDNEKQLKWGASLFQSDSVREDHPSFVIFPQCPDEYYWANSLPMDKLRAMIDAFVKTNNVDIKRIYIVGMSMGAYGTYEMAARNPGLFAAAIAISGDGDQNRIANMAKSQWKIYAGEKDNIVSSDKSESMAKALAKSGAKVSIKVYPDANHVGSWVKAFEEPDFCNWLYSVSKN